MVWVCSKAGGNRWRTSNHGLGIRSSVTPEEALQLHGTGSSPQVPFTWKATIQLVQQLLPLSHSLPSPWTQTQPPQESKNISNTHHVCLLTTLSEQKKSQKAAFSKVHRPHKIKAKGPKRNTCHQLQLAAKWGLGKQGPLQSCYRAKMKSQN